MNYFEFKFKINPFKPWSEIVAAYLSDIDFDGFYYFVGQSRNRNYSKNLGVSKNISIDAGIIIFDPVTKASRFLQLPPKISEIHSILLL